MSRYCTKFPRSLRTTVHLKALEVISSNANTNDLEARLQHLLDETTHESNNTTTATPPQPPTSTISTSDVTASPQKQTKTVETVETVQQPRSNTASPCKQLPVKKSFAPAISPAPPKLLARSNTTLERSKPRVIGLNSSQPGSPQIQSKFRVGLKYKYFR